MSADQRFRGEQKCESVFQKTSKPCENFAYYLIPSTGKILCGVHSRSSKKVRKDLPKNPNKQKLLNQHHQEHQNQCDTIAQQNWKDGKIGKIICSKMKMMKNPPDVPGFVKVFPNFKHANRSDGLGYATLSPKSMGPVNHVQPGLPPAKSIENYHQFNKVFAWELNKDGSINDDFFAKQKEAYLDSVPHRHKFSSDEIKQMKRQLNDDSNINVPKFSVHLTRSGEMKRFTYIESRLFYCHYYELLVESLKEFNHLIDLLKRGYNLQICGYDAYDMIKLDQNESDVDMFYRFYLDDSRPFGHELVLACILTLRTTIGDGCSHLYPWNRFHQMNQHLYDGCI